MNITLARDMSHNVTLYLNWSDATWKKSMYWENVKYFKVSLTLPDKKDEIAKYVNASPNVSS